MLERQDQVSSNKLVILFLAIVATLLVSGCGGYKPEEIQYGIDQCDYCKMTIADQSFSSELITQKGKVLKYDSIECLAAADLVFANKSQEVHSRWVTDFGEPGQFLDANRAWIVLAERQKSPMGIGLVAVNSEESAAKLIDDVGGRIVTWSEIKEIVTVAWKLENSN